MKIIDMKLLSKRESEIVCTVTLPEVENKMPILLMAHGFCSSRHENGTFKMLAEKLAYAGIASIRCDFAGCNESQENHQFNNLENDMDDVDTMLAYMKETYKIDDTRIGILGYSMGGKIALHYTKRHPEIRVVGLWAPAAMNGLTGTGSELGNISEMERWSEIAHRDGFYPYHNSFDGRIVPLGSAFFDQVLNSKANDYFSEFDGHIIMVNGDADDIIPPDVLQQVADCANKKADFVHHVVKGANHGFGAWTNEPHQMDELVQVTFEFMNKNL